MGLIPDGIQADAPVNNSTLCPEKHRDPSLFSGTLLLKYFQIFLKKNHHFLKYFVVFVYKYL